MKPFLAKIYSLIFGILILTNISFANSTTFSEGPPKLNTLNIELSITATNVTCNGLANGTASAIVSGGLAPYHWNNGSSDQALINLSAGIYVVTVTDSNSETAAAQISISQPDSLKLNIAGVILNCAFPQQTLHAVITGGTGPYLFSWNSGEDTSDIVVDSMGMYILAVNDTNACSVIDTAVIKQDFNQPQVHISPPGIISCAQPVVQIYATSDPTGYYLWTTPDGHFVSGLNSLNPLVDKPGVFILKSIDTLNGCIAYDTTIVKAVLPVIAKALITNVNCFGDSTGVIFVSATGGQSPYKLFWSTGDTTSFIKSLKTGTYTVIIRDQTSCRDTLQVEITQPTKLEATISSTSLTGPGNQDGSATLIPLGGVGPYSVLWNTNATSFTIQNLASGLYSAVVKDSFGCATEQSTYINPYNCSMQISSYTIPVGCYGGSNGIVCVNGDNGTFPYGYLWNSGETSNCLLDQKAGIHTVTITDAVGCIEIRQIQLSQPTQIEVKTDSISTTSETGKGFNDGTAQVVAQGGVPPFNYNLGNGTSEIGTGLSAGSHSVTITDSKGCTKIISINIGVYPCNLLGINFVNFSYNGTCHNAPVTLCANTILGGIEPYTYLWSNGSTLSCATDILNNINAVTITDAKNCPAKFFLNYTPPEAMQIEFKVINTHAGQQIGSIEAKILLGGTPPFNYYWTGPDGFTSNLKDLINLPIGIYCLTVTDANGCSEKKCTEVNLNVSTQSLSEGGWNLFPNPAKYILYLQNPNNTSSDINWEILDVNANVLIKGAKENSKNTVIDISQLYSGYYFIQIKDQSGRVQIGKFGVIK